VDDQKYAGFWIRLAAALIDTVLLAIAVYLPLTLIYGKGDCDARYSHWQK